MAMITQRAGEDQVNKALGTLGQDNMLFSLSEPLESAYTNAVKELIGEDLFDWLMYWMWECDMGTKDMEFIIDGTSYYTNRMTLYRFLELVDETN